MADEDLLPPEDELDPNDPLDPVDDDTDSDPEPSPGDDDPDGDTNDDQHDNRDNRGNDDRRAPRGQPDARQRERRLSERERFQRDVDAAVERRMAQNNPQRPAVDYQRQAQERDARRRQELDAARMEGPESYADVRDRHLREDVASERQTFQAQQHDQSDSLRFERARDRDPLIDSVADEVETEYSKLRSQGLLPQREIIADVILGRKYRERASRAGKTQRRAAGETVRRQSVRNPVAPSGQQSAPRRRSGNFSELSVEEMESQLSSVPIKGS